MLQGFVVCTFYLFLVIRSLGFKLTIFVILVPVLRRLLLLIHLSLAMSLHVLLHHLCQLLGLAFSDGMVLEKFVLFLLRYLR